MKSNNKSSTQARPAVPTPTITIKGLADQFGGAVIGASFTCGNPNTHLQYPMGPNRVMARILSDLVGFAAELPADDMTAELAVGFLDHVTAGRCSEHGRALSEPTTCKIAVTASSMFSYGIDRGLCRNNPFRDIQDLLMKSIRETHCEKDGARS